MMSYIAMHTCRTFSLAESTGSRCWRTRSAKYWWYLQIDELWKRKHEDIFIFHFCRGNVMETSSQLRYVRIASTRNVFLLETDLTCLKCALLQSGDIIGIFSSQHWLKLAKQMSPLHSRKKYLSWLPLMVTFWLVIRQYMIFAKYFLFQLSSTFCCFMNISAQSQGFKLVQKPKLVHIIQEILYIYTLVPQVISPSTWGTVRTSTPPTTSWSWRMRG